MEAWAPVTPCVRDLDAEGCADHVEQELEVPARDAAVGGGVVREFRHDQPGRVQRKFPGAQLFGGEQTGETGAPRGGGQQEAEVADGAAGAGEFLIHVTQRGRMRLLWGVTLWSRTVTVRCLSGVSGLSGPCVWAGRRWRQRVRRRGAHVGGRRGSAAEDRG